MKVEPAALTDITNCLFFLYGCIKSRAGMQMGHTPEEAFASFCRLRGLDPYHMMVHLDGEWEDKHKESKDER